MSQDSQLQQAVLAELQWEPSVAAGHIGVSARAGVVTLTGHVESMAPASGLEFSLLPPDNATGNFTKIVQRIPVKIRLESIAGYQGRLRPGMSVEASVDTKVKS